MKIYVVRFRIVLLSISKIHTYVDYNIAYGMMWDVPIKTESHNIVKLLAQHSSHIIGGFS